MRFDPQSIIAYRNNILLPEEIWKLETFYNFINPQREENFLRKLDDLKRKLYSLNSNEENMRPLTIPALSKIFDICDTILLSKIKIVEEYEKHTANEVIQAENIIDKLLDFELCVKELLSYEECPDDIGNVFEILKHVQNPNLIEKIFKLLILSYFNNGEFQKNSKYYIEASHFIRSYFAFLQENKGNYLEFLKAKAKSSKNVGYDLYKGIRDKMKTKDMPLLNVLNDIGKDKDFSDFFNQAVEEYSEKSVPVPALAKKIFNQFQKSYEEFKIDFYKVIGTLYLFKDYISLLTDPNSYTLVYHMATYTAFSGLYLNDIRHQESELNFLNDFFVPATPNLSFIKILVEFKEMYENAEGANKLNLLNVMLNMLYALKVNLKFLLTVTSYSDKKLKQEFMELLVNPNKNPEPQPGPSNKGFLFKLFNLFYSAYCTNISKQFKKHRNIFLNMDPYDEAKDIYTKVFQEILEIFIITIENFNCDNVLNDAENSTFIKNFQAEIENILLQFDFEKNYVCKHILYYIQKCIYAMSTLNGYDNNLRIDKIYDKWSQLLRLISSHDMIERLKLETDVHYEKLTGIFSIYNAIIVKFKKHELENIIYEGNLLQFYVQNFKKMKEIAFNIIPKRFFSLLEDCLLHLFQITIPTHTPHLKEIAEKTSLKEIIPESLALLRLEGIRLKILHTIFTTYKGSFLMFRWFVNKGIFTNLLLGFLSTTEFHKEPMYEMLFNSFNTFLMDPIAGDEIFSVKIDRIYSDIIKAFISIVYNEWEDFFKVVNKPDYQIYNVALKKQSIKILELKYVGMFLIFMKMKNYMKESYFINMMRPITLPFLLFNNGEKICKLNQYIVSLVNKTNGAMVRSAILGMLNDITDKINLKNYDSFQKFINKNDIEMEFFKLDNYENALLDYLTEEKLIKLSPEYLRLIHYIRLHLLLPKWYGKVSESIDLYCDYYENTRLISHLIINLNRLIPEKIFKQKDQTISGALIEISKFDRVMTELNTLLSSRLYLTMKHLDQKPDNPYVDFFINLMGTMFEMLEINPSITNDDKKVLLKNWLMAKTFNVILKQMYSTSMRKTQANYHILSKNDTLSRLLTWIAIFFNKYRLKLDVHVLPSNDDMIEQVFNDFYTLLQNLVVIDCFNNQPRHTFSILASANMLNNISEFYDNISLQQICALEQNTSHSLLEGINKIASSILEFTLTCRKEDEIDLIKSMIYPKVEEIIKKTSPSLFVFKEYLKPKNEQNKQLNPQLDVFWAENTQAILEHYTGLCANFTDLGTLSMIQDPKNQEKEEELPKIFTKILEFHSAFSLANSLLKCTKNLKPNLKIKTIITSALSIKIIVDGYFDIKTYTKYEKKLNDIEFLSRLRRLLAEILNMFFCFIVNIYENGLNNTDEKTIFFSNIIETIIIILKKHNELNSIYPNQFLIQSIELNDEIQNVLLAIFIIDKTQAMSFLAKDGLRLFLSRKIDTETTNKSFRIGQIIDVYFLNSLPLGNWIELELRRMLCNSKNQAFPWKNLENLHLMKAFYSLDKPSVENIFKKLLVLQDKKAFVFAKDYDLTKIVNNWNTQSTQDILSFIFQNTSKITKEAINVICNVIIQNHLDNLAQFCLHKNTKGFKPMSEIIRILNALIVKYPHVVPLILFKDMSQSNFNLKEFQSLGVYRILNNLETTNGIKKLTFLRYYIRIIFYEEPSIACEVFRAMLCKSGIYFKLQNEPTDINFLVAVTILEEIIDILQEESNDSQFFKSVDSVLICHFYSLLGEFVLRKISNNPNIFDKIRFWHEKLISLLLKIAQQISKLDCEPYGKCDNIMITITEIVERYYKNLFGGGNYLVDVSNLKRKYYLQILEMIQKSNSISAINDKETTAIYNTYVASSAKKGNKDDQISEYEFNIYKSSSDEIEIRKCVLKQLMDKDFNFPHEFKIIDFKMDSPSNFDTNALTIEEKNVDIELSKDITTYFKSNIYGDTYIQPLINPYYQKPHDNIHDYPVNLHNILRKAVEIKENSPTTRNDYTHPLLNKGTTKKPISKDNLVNFSEIITIIKPSISHDKFSIKDKSKKGLSYNANNVDGDDMLPVEPFKNKDSYQVLFSDTNIVNLENEKDKKAALKDWIKRGIHKLNHYLESRELKSFMNSKKNNSQSKEDYSKENIEFINSLSGSEKKIILALIDSEFASTLSSNLKTERKICNFHLKKLMNYEEDHEQEEGDDDEEEEDSNNNEPNDKGVGDYEHYDNLYSAKSHFANYHHDNHMTVYENPQDGRLETNHEYDVNESQMDISADQIDPHDIFNLRLKPKTLPNYAMDTVSSPLASPSSISLVDQALLKKKEILAKLYTFDDKLIEGILSFLFTVFPDSTIDDKMPIKALNYFKLLSRLMLNPIIEIKVLDAMFYVISNPKIYLTFQKIDAYSKDPDLIFPQKGILNRSAIKNTQDIYTIVVNNILHFIKYYISNDTTKSRDIFYLSSNLLKQYYFKYVSILRKNHPTGKKQDDKDFSIINSVISALEIEEIKNHKHNLAMIINILDSLLNNSKGIGASDSNDLTSLYIAEDKSFQNIPNIYYISKANLDYLVDQITSETKDNLNLGIVSNSSFGSKLIKNLLEPIAKDSELILSKICKRIILAQVKDLLPKLDKVLKAIKNNQGHITMISIEMTIDSLLTIEDATNLNKIGTLLRAVSDFFSIKLRKPTNKESYNKYTKSLSTAIDEFVDANQVYDLVLILHDIMDQIRKVSQNIDANVFNGISFEVIKGIIMVLIYHFSIINLSNDTKNKEYSSDSYNNALDSDEEKKIESPSKLSRLVTFDYEIINPQPQQQQQQQKNLTKNSSNSKTMSLDRDYPGMFSTFLASCNHYTTIYFFKFSEDVNKYEICNLISKYPMLMAFKYKSNEYLNNQMNKYMNSFGLDKVDRRLIAIRRKKLVQDSMKAFNTNNKKILLQKVYINFKGESNTDSGGIRREWFTLLCQEFTNPNRGLFELGKNGKTLKINPFSASIPDYISYFRCFGIIVAKAIQDGCLIDVTFTKSIYKHILGRELNIQDLDDIDPEMTKSLDWLLKNKADNLNQSFNYEMNIFGNREVIELIPNGSQILVNDKNKKDYVKRLCQAKLTDEINTQMQAFLDGFRTIIPKNIISIFSPSELEMLMSGMKIINIDAWKKKTRYEGINENEELVQWFWEIVSEFNQNARAALLHFISGSTKLLHADFEGDALVINVDGSQPDQLPRAYTCFNELRMPRYESKDKLKQKLMLAIFEGKEGFFIQFNT